MNKNNLDFLKIPPSRPHPLHLFIYLFFALDRWTNFEFYVLSFGTDDEMADNKGVRYIYKKRNKKKKKKTTRASNSRRRDKYYK